MAEPKYRSVLTALIAAAETMEPGARFPSVRQLMKEYAVSQAAIERCLDEMFRQGLIRRERARGIFIE
ncbi:MAG: GntR family transcriptional regulator, partial [Planctomycetota bacterium]